LEKLNRSVLVGGQWAYGPYSKSLERLLAEDLGCEDVVLSNSGTSALVGVLLSLRERRSEKRAVIVPAFGYVAAAHAATLLGFDLYVADILPGVPVIDPRSAARLMDSNVAAVVGIDYFGYSVDWDEMPRTDGVLLIEDAAGAYGAQYRGRALGTAADVGIFSFHISKGLWAMGEGGAVASNDHALVESVRASLKHGQRAGYYRSEALGINALMTDGAAFFLHNSLSGFESNMAVRASVKLQLDSVCNKFGISTSPSNEATGGRIQNFQSYLVLEDDRDFLLEVLRIGGIEARPCWPLTLVEQPSLLGTVKKVDGAASESRELARRVLNLPIHPDVDSGHINVLCEALALWAARQ